MDFKDRLEFALLESNEKRCIIVNVYEPDAPGERVAGIWQLIPFSSLDSAYNWVREQDPEQDFGIEDKLEHIRAASYLCCPEGQTGVSLYHGYMEPYDKPIPTFKKPGILPDIDEFEVEFDTDHASKEIQVYTRDIPTGNIVRIHSFTGERFN